MPLRSSLLLSCFVTFSLAVLAANPVPFVNQPLVPTSATPGTSGFTLTVHGTGFVASSVVKWNGSARTTTFVSSSELQAAISSSDVASAGSASITVNSGGADSNAALFWIASPATSLSFASHEITRASNPSGLVTADFNGDLKTDVALSTGFSSLSSGPNQVGIFLGNGDATFLKPSDYKTAQETSGVATGDFNADGKIDLAVSGQLTQFISSDWAFATLLGNGDGTFKPAKFQAATFRGSSQLLVADFNGDGRLDVAAIYADNTGYIAVALGKGDGTFAPFVTTPAFGGFTAVGDFNGDGILDLAGTNTSSGPQIALGNGDGTFQAPTKLPGSTAEAVVVADFNGDGKLDIAFEDFFTMNVCLGNGDGTFQTCTSYPDDPVATTSLIQVVDLNADGKLDLITARSGDNAFTYFLGNGDGTFQPWAKIALSGFGPGPGSFAIGDFNGDGRADAVFTAGSSDNSNLGLYRLLQHP